MTQPGWYPDPGGPAHQLRYWDGARWSPQTRPPTPGGGPGTPPPPSRSAIVLFVLILAVLLVAVLVIWRAFTHNAGSGSADDTSTAAPTVSAWDETSTSSPSSSDLVPCPDPEGDTDTDTPQPSTAGRLRLGPLSVPSLPGWGPRPLFSVSGASGWTAQAKGITSEWVSTSAIALATKEDFPTVRVAAQAITDCMATSGYYSGLTHIETITTERVQIGAHAGYHIRVKVFVNDKGPTIPGDVLDVVVVDMGTSSDYGVYLSTCTIGDTATQAEVDSARADLRVDA